MRAKLIFLAIMCSGLHLQATEIADIVASWRQEVDSFPTDEQAMSELSRRVLANEPNGSARLRQMHKLVVETPVEKRTEYGMVFLSIWHELAAPEERAKFISELVVSPSEPTDLSIAETYLKTDVVDKDKALRDEESGESDRTFSESFFDVSHYTSEKINFSTRLTALLFSVAPGATLRDVSAVSNDEETRELVERAQMLRADLERNRNNGSWDELQTVLTQLSRNDDFAVQAYLARVIAWGRKLFPQMDFKSEIVEKVSGTRSDLISYLLNSNKPEDLLEIPRDDASPLVRAQNNGVQK